MRSVRNKPALAFERLIEAIQKIVECLGQPAELIIRVANFEPFVQIYGTNAFRLLAHGGNGCQTSARQKIAADARQQHAQRDQPREGDANLFQHFLLRMTGAKNHEQPGLAIRRETGGVRPKAAFFSRDGLIAPALLRGRLDKTLKAAGSERARGYRIRGIVGRHDVRRARGNLPRGIHQQQNIASHTVL